MTAHPEPLFEHLSPGPLGRRFMLYHAPGAGAARGLVLHVHALGEEMNKSRRMAALQSRALAATGFAVLQIDLLGCGDSAGDHGDACWAAWQNDVIVASRWLRQRHPQSALPLWVWGQRAGALLAAQAARQIAGPCNFLFWHPAANGKAVLQQWLRLKAAGDLAGGQAKAVMAQLRAELAAGRAIEVAGYQLGPGLCQGLEMATLQPPPAAPDGGCALWFEISAQADAEPSPAAAAQVEAWRLAGWQVRLEVVTGPAFWQTTEIEDAPALIAASLAGLSAAAAGLAARPPIPAALEAKVAQ